VDAETLTHEENSHCYPNYATGEWIGAVCPTRNSPDYVDVQLRELGRDDPDCEKWCNGGSDVRIDIGAGDENSDDEDRDRYQFEREC